MTTIVDEQSDKLMDQALQVNDLQVLQQHAEQAAQLMRQLSNPNRLMILCTLMQEELSVGELNLRIPLSQSALSQHLAGLRQAQLVATRRSGQVIYYRLEGVAVARVIGVLKDLYCPALPPDVNVDVPVSGDIAHD